MAFQIDITKLGKADVRQLKVRRKIVEFLTYLRAGADDDAERREIDKAALDHALRMLRNTERKPIEALNRRIQASKAWRDMPSLDHANNAARYRVRAAIISELKLSSYEIEMADHDSLLPRSLGVE